MPLFGLVDCNSFYVSCERVFQPALADRPVVVLSNNDGCVIARSGEARALGIPMGAPAFTLRSLIARHGVIVRSSNYALYGDLSERVMGLLAEAAPACEIYSIDEAFLDLDGLAVADLAAWCRDLQRRIRHWTGIPVSIGLGPTKTLAKLANHLAKTEPQHGGVFGLAEAAGDRQAALARTPVGEVWGIGRRRAPMLESRGLRTALDLSRAETGWVRQRMGVVGLRTVHELRGLACHPLETQPPARKSTCCSRSFGRAVTDRAAVAEAVLAFATRAAEKIRKARQAAGAVQLFLATDRFDRKARQCSLAASLTLAPASHDSRDIAAAALRLLDRLWREGYAWRKAGVLLLDLTDTAAIPAQLFDAHPFDTHPFDTRPARADGTRLMAAMDRLNDRFGRGTVTLGLASRALRASQAAKASRATQAARPTGKTGRAHAREAAAWAMRQTALSPCFTTRWSDLPVARTEDRRPR